MPMLRKKRWVITHFMNALLHLQQIDDKKHILKKCSASTLILHDDDRMVHTNIIQKQAGL